MGTSLCLLTNTSLEVHKTEKDWNGILKKLKGLNLEKNLRKNYQGTIVKEEGDWTYQVVPFDSEHGAINCIEFEGPFLVSVYLYPNAAELCTWRRYGFLYEMHQSDTFETFRITLFKVMQILGATEGFYVGDVDKLESYFDLAIEKNSYSKIKSTFIDLLGPPVTDYGKLNKNTLDYNNINEFFLDDFNDLK